MAALPKPCLKCGALTSASHCSEHTPKPPDLRRGRDRSHVGRDYRWDQLSKRARALQDFCGTCGTRGDLTTDHTPQAWARIALRLPIRLQDVQVLCRSCNSALGPAQPGSKRYDDWLHSVGKGPSRGVPLVRRGLAPVRTAPGALRRCAMKSSNAGTGDARRSRTRRGASPVSIGVASRADLVMVMRLGILPVLPSMQFQPTSQRLRHLRSLLSIATSRNGVRPCRECAATVRPGPDGLLLHERLVLDGFRRKAA
jgi:5-methylcytosine-specific restriction protein A